MHFARILSRRSFRHSLAHVAIGATLVVVCASAVAQVIAQVIEAPPATVTSTPTPTAQPAPANLEVIDAKFGLFEGLGTSTPVFTPTAQVPLKVGQAYGWLIVVNSSLPKLAWREELTLPAPPVTWGQGSASISYTVAQAGKTSVTVRELDLTGPRTVLANAWRVNAGDPPGRYEMKVLINNQVERRFSFEVQ